MIKQIADTLEARELFKVSVLQNCEFDRREVAEELAKGARAEIVQVIGSTIVLYKESRENKQIKLLDKNSIRYFITNNCRDRNQLNFY